jgi:L-histidine Nalpha-methyltransferase
MSAVAERGFRYRVGATTDTVDAFARDVAEGLGAPRKTLPCRYLYDPRGTDLFDEITRQDEYYLTRAENEIIARHADDIAAAGGRNQVLIELGPGRGQKARAIIDSILRRQGRLTYHPIDVSVEALRQGCAPLLREFRSLGVEALAADFNDGIASIFAQEPGPALVAFLGSSFGNFHEEEGLRFLGRMRRHMRPFDLLLLGLDLRKDPATLLKAYDDAAGVTALFNLNLLNRINRELDGDFPGDGFQHVARYEARAGRVEMHLKSLAARFVRVEKLDRYFWFEEGETIWTESAYKYTRRQIAKMCALTGFNALHQWYDDASRFTVLLLAPSPNRGLFNALGVSE